MLVGEQMCALRNKLWFVCRQTGHCPTVLLRSVLRVHVVRPHSSRPRRMLLQICPNLHSYSPTQHTFAARCVPAVFLFSARPAVTGMRPPTTLLYLRWCYLPLVPSGLLALGTSLIPCVGLGATLVDCGLSCVCRLMRLLCCAAFAGDRCELSQPSRPNCRCAGNFTTSLSARCCDVSSCCLKQAACSVARWCACARGCACAALVHMWRRVAAFGCVGHFMSWQRPRPAMVTCSWVLLAV